MLAGNTAERRAIPSPVGSDSDAKLLIMMPPPLFNIA